MGIQSFNDDALRLLGRLHTVAEARAAYEIARTTFSRVSFDLIYARQNQTLSDWRGELASALTLAVDHLSLYQLTIEDGTAFGDRFARGKLRGLPGDDLAADMYALTQELCDQAGLAAYEVSNHAAPDAQSRHNLIYWRSGDYAGIGPGAHGRLTLAGRRTSTETAKAPGAWLTLVEDKGNGETLRQVISPEEQASEYLMMGMRLSEGMDVDRFTQLAGAPLSPESISRLTDLGMVVAEGQNLRTTPAGRIVLNAVLRELMPG